MNKTDGATAGPTGAADLPLEIRRSARRRRTVSAVVRDGRLVLMVPAGLSAQEEEQWAERMRARLASSRRRRPGDVDLEQRATVLARRYLHGRAEPTSVSWVGNQQHRWGSCTITTGAIRISERVRDMPAWVVDYVLVHELAHLIEADHSARFWSLVAAYPHTERARGYLEGYATATAWAVADDCAGDP